MIDQLAAGVGLALVTFGVFALFSAALGLFRLRGALDRVHAAAMADTLGLFSLLIGTALLHGWSLPAGKTILVLLILWRTGPVACHLLAGMEADDIPEREERQEAETR